MWDRRDQTEHQRGKRQGGNETYDIAPARSDLFARVLELAAVQKNATNREVDSAVDGLKVRPTALKVDALLRKQDAEGELAAYIGVTGRVCEA